MLYIFILQSVVSASTEPDTIVLARDANDELRIDSINPGQKNQKIVLTGKKATFVYNLRNCFMALK